MISNVMCLACLPFWGETCPISCHEDTLFQAILAVKKVKRQPTCKQLNELAWDLDAAKFRDYEGPVNCSCYNKQKLVNLLLKLYKNCSVGTCVESMWGCQDAWDAPMPAK